MSNRSIPSVGLAAGLGLCLGLASQARAEDYSYGHAEITLGFPHGQVTVGRVWDTEPQEVVVTHKLPDPDYDDEVTPRDEDEDDGEADIIIEKREHHRHHRHHRRVVIIENRYEEPSYCDRHEVRRVYVEPSRHCGGGAVVYRAPERVIYAPSRVIVAPPRYEHGGYGDGYHGHDNGHGGGGYDHPDRGPRNLFPQDSGRPTRMRGVQRVAVR
jgi:hypothetical protein